MITIATLKAWGFVASLVASSNARHLSDAVLEGMAHWAINDPIVVNDDASIQTMMSIEVAIAWWEGSNQLNPAGSNDGGNSHCWAQIYLPNNGRTQEGWTGAQLRSDPMKCAKVAVRNIKRSLAASPTCDECGLTFYAAGRDVPIGRTRSRERLGTAHRLLRDVPWKSDEENP